MIYSKILNPKHKKLFRGLAITMLLMFSLTLNACFTTKTEYYSPDEFNDNDNKDITEIKFRNGNHLKSLDNYYFNLKKIDTIADVILLEIIDTIYTSYDTAKITKIFEEIKFENILNLKTETNKIHIGNTLLVGLGIGVVILAISWFSWAHNSNNWGQGH